MACTRITTGGRSWIAHDRHCAGRGNIALCLYWIAEEEFKRQEEHRRKHHHGHHHPYGEPDHDRNEHCEHEEYERGERR